MKKWEQYGAEIHEVAPDLWILEVPQVQARTLAATLGIGLDDDEHENLEYGPLGESHEAIMKERVLLTSKQLRDLHTVLCNVRVTLAQERSGE
tara:strand:+ start:273 stop:551 length:279 start_codon:yes stop_codon:yes gene_type:complete